MSSLPNVFAYLDFRAYLRDWFDAKKQANPRFSHRLFARRAGQKSPSVLLHAIDGTRNLSPAVAEGFVRAIGLEPEESSFFLALVRLQCAEDGDSRDRAMAQVQATRRFREARRIDAGSLEYLSRWYYPAIRELASCSGFRADPAWIATTLRPPIREQDAREALKLLEVLGLLRRDADGTLRPTDASVVTPHEVAGMAARQYHVAMIDRAREALEIPHQDRHLLGITVSIPAKLVPKLKRELDELQERLLDLCDAASDDHTVVVQVNLQMIPLSRSTQEAS